MRIIKTDLASGNITGNANANFPITNLSDYNPKKVWKGLSRFETLTIAYSGIGGDDIGLFNCNTGAGTGIIAYRFKTGAVVDASGNMDWDGNDNFWVDAPGTSSTSLELDLGAASGEISEAGVLRAGSPVEFDDPLSMNQSYVDFSIRRRTRNQAILRKQKDRIWMLSGNVLSYAETDSGDIALVELSKDVAPYPIAIKVLEKNFIRFVFGELTASGTVNHDAKDTTGKWLATCNFQIEEVI